MKLFILILLTVIFVFLFLCTLKGSLKPDKDESYRANNIISTGISGIVIGVLMFCIIMHVGEFPIKTTSWVVKDIDKTGVIKMNKQHVSTLPPENVIYHEYNMKLTNGERDTTIVYRCSSEFEPVSLIGKRIILHEK